MGEVVEGVEAATHRPSLHAFQPGKVDIVDTDAVLVAIDQVDGGAAYALDRRQPQLHGPGLHHHRLRSPLQGPLVGMPGIAHPERHATGGGAVLTGVVIGVAAGLVVGNEIDVALTPQGHLLGAVHGHFGEAHHLEHRLQHPLPGRGEFNELETVQSHGVVKQVCHSHFSCGRLSRLALLYSVGRPGAAGDTAYPARDRRAAM